ncbi:Patched domain-containing protein 3 [Manis javanica]|nr:Patched domain-containing protein 3 [Manis javanica]
MQLRKLTLHGKIIWLNLKLKGMEENYTPITKHQQSTFRKQHVHFTENITYEATAGQISNSRNGWKQKR